MTLYQLIAREKNRLIREKSELEHAIRESPPGTLTFNKNRVNGKTYYKWYVKGEFREKRTNKRYLRRREKALAKELAKKRLNQARLNDIDHELKALDAYLSKHSDGLFLHRLLDSPELGRFFGEERVTVSDDLAEELDQWASAEYEMNPLYPEQRVVPTDRGIKVRSKSEAIILTFLSMFHIPFRYECRLEVGGHIYYPDFTIRHPLTGEYYYWEHVGMLENPNYKSSFLSKFNIYISNGILPDKNLILTFESENHPLDIRIVMDKLEEFFFCNKKAIM